ncbi:hypothetical protein FA95DRAFT_1200976 [Auriscalpium vulgare]|uniref:Uncharacterized protein n=1 Tax=Auriscalpium vulgare TaxID=40419 RepID=A0ACB8R393_9AGAM|nr:hypothetical protein FA95DRAFT_1200976 [Auriscalpium vulgare]
MPPSGVLNSLGMWTPAICAAPFISRQKARRCTEDGQSRELTRAGNATPSPQSTHSQASSASRYSPRSDQLIGRMDVLSRWLLTTTCGFMPVPPRSKKMSSTPQCPLASLESHPKSPMSSDARIVLVDELCERIASLGWNRADDGRSIEDLEDALGRMGRRWSRRGRMWTRSPGRFVSPLDNVMSLKQSKKCRGRRSEAM